MRKTLHLVAAVLFFTSCGHTEQPKPDADRVIKDTLAEMMIMRPFNQAPAQQNIYVKVDAAQEKELCARGSAIKKLMDGLKTDPQKFIIDNTQPTQITGSQGTRLSFTPNSFISKEGTEVLTPVTVELKECYTPGTMLRENLLTSAEGGVSASKGMIYLNAYAGGQAVQLKADHAVNIQFPFSTDGNNYKLYHGDENNDGFVVWNAVCGQKPAGLKVNPATDFIKPEFWYLGQGLKDYLLQNIEYPDEARRNELSANVDVTFMVNKEGKVSDVITAESYKIFRQVIEASLKNMPAWKPAAYNGNNIASSVHINIDFNIRRVNQVQVDFNESKASLIGAGNNVYLLYGTDLKGEVQGLPAQALGQLGWFNYGRPLKTGKQTAELLVASNENSEIKLLLKNSKAIVGGENCVGFTDFKDLPLGEEACIVAIRYYNGSMLYAVQQVTLSKQSVIVLKWKKGTSEELAKVYHCLGKSVS